MAKSSFLIPVPLSWIWSILSPPPRTVTFTCVQHLRWPFWAPRGQQRTCVLPASSAFSRSSFKALAGRWITSPAAILLTTTFYKSTNEFEIPSTDFSILPEPDLKSVHLVSTAFTSSSFLINPGSDAIRSVMFPFYIVSEINGLGGASQNRLIDAWLFKLVVYIIYFIIGGQVE